MISKAVRHADRKRSGLFPQSFISPNRYEGPFFFLNQRRREKTDSGPLYLGASMEAGEHKVIPFERPRRTQQQQRSPRANEVGTRSAEVLARLLRKAEVLVEVLEARVGE